MHLYFKKDFCEKVYSAYHYYSISDKLSNTFRITLTLINAGIAMDLRNAFQAPEAHHSLTDILSIPFTDKIAANTFLLNYVGRTSFGAMQKYIVNQVNDMDAPEIGISGEIANINGKFVMSFVFDFEEDLYLKAICQEFEEQGLKYTCGPLEEFHMPRCTP